MFLDELELLKALCLSRFCWWHF